MSDLVRPMLPTAGPLPAGPEWAFEFDWDGVRSLACSQPGRMRLFSSTHRSISAAYPELEAFPGRRRMLLDGKIVALDSCGRPSLRWRERSRPGWSPRCSWNGVRRADRA